MSVTREEHKAIRLALARYEAANAAVELTDERDMIALITMDALADVLNDLLVAGGFDVRTTRFEDCFCIMNESHVCGRENDPRA